MLSDLLFSGSSPSELQGIYTAREIHIFLQARNRVDAYPLFASAFIPSSCFTFSRFLCD